MSAKQKQKKSCSEGASLYAAVTFLEGTETRVIPLNAIFSEGHDGTFHVPVSTTKFLSSVQNGRLEPLIIREKNEEFPVVILQTSDNYDVLLNEYCKTNKRIQKAKIYYQLRSNWVNKKPPSGKRTLHNNPNDYGFAKVPRLNLTRLDDGSKKLKDDDICVVQNESNTLESLISEKKKEVIEKPSESVESSENEEPNKVRKPPLELIEVSEIFDGITKQLQDDQFSTANYNQLDDESAKFESHGTNIVENGSTVDGEDSERGIIDVKKGPEFLLNDKRDDGEQLSGSIESMEEPAISRGSTNDSENYVIVCRNNNELDGQANKLENGNTDMIQSVGLGNEDVEKAIIGFESEIESSSNEEQEDSHEPSASSKSMRMLGTTHGTTNLLENDPFSKPNSILLKFQDQVTDLGNGDTDIITHVKGISTGNDFEEKSVGVESGIKSSANEEKNDLQESSVLLESMKKSIIPHEITNELQNESLLKICNRPLKDQTNKLENGDTTRILKESENDLFVDANQNQLDDLANKLADGDTNMMEKVSYTVDGGDLEKEIVVGGTSAEFSVNKKPDDGQEPSFSLITLLASLESMENSAIPHASTDQPGEDHFSKMNDTQLDNQSNKLVHHIIKVIGDKNDAHCDEALNDEGTEKQRITHGSDSEVTKSSRSSTSFNQRKQTTEIVNSSDLSSDDDSSTTSCSNETVNALKMRIKQLEKENRTLKLELKAVYKERDGLSNALEKWKEIAWKNRKEEERDDKIVKQIEVTIERILEKKEKLPDSPDNDLVVNSSLEKISKLENQPVSDDFYYELAKLGSMRERCNRLVDRIWDKKTILHVFTNVPKARNGDPKVIRIGREEKNAMKRILSKALEREEEVEEESVEKDWESKISKWISSKVNSTRDKQKPDEEKRTKEIKVLPGPKSSTDQSDQEPSRAE